MPTWKRDLAHGVGWHREQEDVARRDRLVEIGGRGQAAGQGDSGQEIWEFIRCCAWMSRTTSGSLDHNVTARLSPGADAGHTAAQDDPEGGAVGAGAEYRDTNPGHAHLWQGRRGARRRNDVTYF